MLSTPFALDPAAAQQPLPYEANFEENQGYLAGDVHGQNGWQVDQGQAEVTAAAGREGSQGLVIAPTDPFGQVSVLFEKDLAYEVAFSDFWIKPALAEPLVNEEFLDQEGSIAGFFRIDEEGEFFVLNGDGQEGGEWVSTGVRVAVQDGHPTAWTRITLRQDFRENGKIWDIYVNGALRAANLGFWSDGSEWLERFTLMGHTQFPLHVDDISIGGRNPLFEDADRDGIPDEGQNHALSGRDEDPDGDGITNVEEFLLGSDPRVSEAVEVGEAPLESPEAVALGLANIYSLPIPFASDGSGTRIQRTQLAASLIAYRQRNDAENTEDLETYVSNTPASPYQLWVEANIARRAYDSGRYSKALSIYERLWQQYQRRPGTNSPFYRLINTVGVDLARLYARLGRKEALGAIIAQFEKRTVRGHDSERLFHATLGYGLMETKPETSFNCGIFAIRNVAKLNGLTDDVSDFLKSQNAEGRGFSLSNLARISEDIGEDLVMAERESDADFIVPCVVHWKSDHYAAITEKREDGRYRVVDPTFGRNFWISEAALMDESSGYFLVPRNKLGVGWGALSDDVGESVWGRGAPSGQTELDDPCDKECGSTSPGMASYSLNHFRASLVVRDTPLFYDTPYGPSMDFTVAYQQSSLSPLSGLNYSNMGDKWFCDWISFIQPISGTSHKELFLPDGRKETHVWDTPNSEYGLHQMSQSRLFSVTGGYERRSDDGSIMKFTKAGKETAPDTRYFLTEIKDPFGNTVTFTYDGNTRLTKVTDPFGNDIDFSYADASNSYLITEIKDTRSTTRKAQFFYDSSDRLQKITDTEGIESSFTYTGSTDRLATMVTPYGTTSFSLVPIIFGRYATVTDPLGLKERVYYYNSLSSSISLPGVSSGNVVNAEYSQLTSDGYSDIETVNVNEGFTLYWDKKAWKDGGNDFVYSKSHQTHWRRSEETGVNLTQGIPSSTRTALTNRVFYIYPTVEVDGSTNYTNQPSHVCQVVKDHTGSTKSKVIEYEYHAESGAMTKRIDPLGREMVWNYESDGTYPDGIDLLSVQINEGGSYKTVASYGSFSNHRPGTVTDAGGNTTSITYTSKNQIKQITLPNSNGKIRFTYDYDPNGPNNNDYGYLIKIERTDPSNTSAFVTVMDITDYDDYDRPITVEDADGYELAYAFDKLNRVTSITYPESPTATTELFYYTNSSGTKFPDLQRAYDREGKLTTYVQNGNRQIIEIHDPEHTDPTEFKWCACGHLDWIIDPDNNKTLWNRDLLGRVTSKVYPDSEQFSYTYETASGLLSTITYPSDSSATVTLKYYTDGNLESKDYADTNAVDSTYYYEQYYDRLDRRKDEGNGYTYNFYYSYHPMDGSTNGGGLLKEVNGPWDDDTVKYTYDDVGRLKKRVIDNTDTAQEHTMEWVYDELGRVESLITGIGTFANSYVGDSELLDEVDYPNGQTVEFAYLTHSQGRFLSEINNYKVGSSTSTLSEFTYTYTDSGQIDRWMQHRPYNSTGSPNIAYYDHTYDDVYQLDTVTRKNLFLSNQEKWDFDYDDAGNRSKRTVTDYGPNPDHVDVDNYVANNRNQITSTSGAGGSFTLTYDDDGNLTKKAKSGGGTMNYEWDANGNLTAIEVLAGSTPATDDTRTEIRYNGEHQRMEILEKERSGSSWVLDTDLDGLEHLYFVWADGQLCQRRTEKTDSTTTKTNFYPRGESRHSSSGTGNKTDFFYNLDHLGTVREMTNSSGAIVAAYRYTPYGIREEQGFSTDSCEIGFTGHHYHERTKLHLAWYRAYDADLGRWISSDPIGEEGGINIYAYAGNNPANDLDPLGLCRKIEKQIAELGVSVANKQRQVDALSAEVKDRIEDLKLDKQGMKRKPRDPNAPMRETREGHVKLLNEKKGKLAKRKAELQSLIERRENLAKKLADCRAKQKARKKAVKKWAGRAGRFASKKAGPVGLGLAIEGAISGFNERGFWGGVEGAIW